MASWPSPRSREPGGGSHQVVTGWEAAGVGVRGLLENSLHPRGTNRVTGAERRF